VAFLLPAGASGAALLNESFDDITTLAGSGWAMTNNSAPPGTSGWFQGNPGVFPAFSGLPDSYVAANVNNAAFPVGNISNWLITPQLSLFGSVEISFYTSAELGSPFPDSLELYLSTSGASTNVGSTDTSTGDFTTLLLAINPGLSVGGYPEDWTQYIVPLTFNSATTGRFAFRYAVTDTSVHADYIGIDDVSVVDNPVPEPGTLGLLAMGGLGLAFARFRRAAK
jgi:hypothetical protein